MIATRTWTAWSCTVRVVVTDGRVVEAAAADVRDHLAAVDAVASRFRADSALAQANRHAGRPVPVPRLLVDLVAIALDAAADTDGAVDPTVGADLAALGYDRDTTDVRDRDVRDVRDRNVRVTGVSSGVGAARCDWTDVRLDRELGLLTVPRETVLDLGATAKAATADHLAGALHRRYRAGVLVELGGDLAVAGPSPSPRGWAVDVAESEGAASQPVFVTSGGLTTSTTTVRRWRCNGEPLHHVLDPRTRRPTSGPWRTATVAAPTALAANAMSTAALVWGGSAEPELARRGVTARLVAADGAVRFVGGWPKPLRPEHESVLDRSLLPTTKDRVA